MESGTLDSLLRSGDKLNQRSRYFNPIIIPGTSLTLLIYSVTHAPCTVSDPRTVCVRVCACRECHTVRDKFCEKLRILEVISIIEHFSFYNERGKMYTFFYSESCHYTELQ